MRQPGCDFEPRLPQHRDLRRHRFHHHNRPSRRHLHGDLRMIAPTVELAPSFYVDGKLEIIKADPSALIPP